MAETLTSRYVDSPYTLRQLIQQSYNSSFRSRWLEPIKRDEKHVVRLERVTRWKVHYSDGVPNRAKVHTFRVRLMNAKNTGTTVYPVTILIDQLSLDAPAKIRCGSLAKYSKGMSHEQMKDRKICGDFYFRGMDVADRMGYLYHRNTTNRKPAKVNNPNNEVLMCKHLISALKTLVATKFFQQVDTWENYAENVSFMRQFS